MWLKYFDLYFEREKNIVGIGENAGYQQFLLSIHVFIRLRSSGSLKHVVVESRNICLGKCNVCVTGSVSVSIPSMQQVMIAIATEFILLYPVIVISLVVMWNSEQMDW